MTRPGRILYADPSPREEPFAAFECVDGVRTLPECLSALEDGYDRIIIDPSLSDAARPTVVKRIRAERPEIPLMVWTDGTEALAGEVIAAGADGYVPKSAGVGTLADRVTGLAGRAGRDAGPEGTVRDRVEIERELRARKRKTTALHEVASALEECRTEREVFETAVGAAQDVLNFDVCAIDRIEGDRLVKAALSSSLEDADIKKEFSIHEGVVGKTYRNRQTYRIGDLAADPDAVPVDGGFRSVLSVPIGDRGVFQAVSIEPDAFDRGDQELAELLVAHVADALDRMAFESRLREERDRFAALFENVPDAVVSIRHRKGEAIVERINPAFERVFGYDEETIAGEPLDPLVVPEEEGEEAEAVNRAGADGEVVEREVRRRTARGLRDFRLQVVPIETEGGETRSFGVYTDITERKRRRERTEVLHRVLRHDLRNGMNVVAGYAELLADDEDAPDREAYAAIRDQADDLVALAERIRAIERALDCDETAGPVDVVDALEDAIETVTGRYPDARVRRFGSDRAYALGTDALRTAIREVVENAAEHADGSATIEAKVEEGEGTVTITVADDGPGIPAAERELLEGDREITQLRHTSGLGLWLVNWIVTRAGGELSFSDNDPRGTVVTLEVPPADPPEEGTDGKAGESEDGQATG